MHRHFPDTEEQENGQQDVGEVVDVSIRAGGDSEIRVRRISDNTENYAEQEIEIEKKNNQNIRLDETIVDAKK